MNRRLLVLFLFFVSIWKLWREIPPPWGSAKPRFILFVTRGHATMRRSLLAFAVLGLAAQVGCSCVLALRAGRDFSPAKSPPRAHKICARPARGWGGIWVRGACCRRSHGISRTSLRCRPCKWQAPHRLNYSDTPCPHFGLLAYCQAGRCLRARGHLASASPR